MINKASFILSLFLVLLLSAKAQENLYLTNLPLQLNINQGSTKEYTLDASIATVLSRKAEIASFTIAGTKLILTGLKAGRTGLKIITTDNRTVTIGLRINNPDGSIPALPDYVSVGSVSEDVAGDLDFWADLHPGLTNKRMDIRYIYINGGVSALGNGWRTWGGDRVGKYCQESIRAGLVPFFVYYNIPDGGESYETDLAHTRDPQYMNGYFDDMNYFFQRIEATMGGDLYGIILEPDFLGYLQQLGPLFGESADPSQIPTAVGANTIGANAGTITTLVERINSTINQKKLEGHKIIFGWQVNLWSCATAPDGSGVQGSQGVMRRTDDLGFDAGRAMIKTAAQGTANFAMKAGILSNGADFVSIDKYGLDAMGYQNTADPAKSTWFFNNDHWNNYLYYVENLHLTTNKPIVLWQLPVGRINSSNTTSAYTGQVFVDLDNTNMKYEDSAPDFFFGDSFTASSDLRKNYFSQNQYKDPKLSVAGNSITWGSHMLEAKKAGVAIALFGAGVGNSTHGTGTPPTENYFWIQKVQDYYQAPVAIDLPFDGNNLACTAGCPPIIIPINPSAANQQFEIYAGDTIFFKYSIYDLNGSIASLKFEINGQNIPYSNLQKAYTAAYVATAFGNFTLKVTAIDNEGKSTISTIPISIVEFDPLACKVPAWEAKIYATTLTQVSYNNLVYTNQWYAADTDIPTVSSVWKYLKPCGDTNIITDPCKTLWVAQDYAANAIVAYNGNLWKNSYWAVATDVPGISTAWKQVKACTGIDILMNVKGNLSFGSIAVGGTSNHSLLIINTGTTQLSIDSISFPVGFSGNWSGKIAAGITQTIPISFSPKLVKNYSGLVKVKSNATSGHYAIPANGNGIITTDIDNVSSSDILIYPNPATEIIQIEAPSLIGNLNIILYDMQGREISTGISADSKFSINTSAIPTGLYIIRITSNSSAISKLVEIRH